MSNLIAIIRVRGSMETRATTEDALCQMHLTRKNHCVLLQNTPQMKGTLVLCRDYITWGGITLQNVELLLKKRSEILPGKRLTDEYVAKNSKFKSIPELAKAISDGTAKMKDVSGLKPLFRLHPPIKGFEGIKIAYPKGALGNRGEKINELISRMV
ncbi:MAG: 50S ribosomal protein L30 [Candidatus Micrarchaeota archaeon]